MLIRGFSGQQEVYSDPDLFSGKHFEECLHLYTSLIFQSPLEHLIRNL